MNRPITFASILALTLATGCSGTKDKAATGNPAGDNGVAKVTAKVASKTVATTKTKVAKEIVASDYTSAPLQYVMTLELEASPDAVWGLIADHKALPSYFAAVNKVTVDNSKASTPGGVGAVRSCALMGMELVEDIRVFEPSRVLGYSVVKGGMPGVTDHLGLVRLSAKGDSTVLRWEQYFDHPQPETVVPMIAKLLNMAGDGLIAKFGGRLVASAK